MLEQEAMLVDLDTPTVLPGEKLLAKYRKWVYLLETAGSVLFGGMSHRDSSLLRNLLVMRLGETIFHKFRHEVFEGVKARERWGLRDWAYFAN